MVDYAKLFADVESGKVVAGRTGNGNVDVIRKEVKTVFKQTGKTEIESCMLRSMLKVGLKEKIPKINYSTMNYSLYESEKAPCKLVEKDGKKYAILRK